LVFSLQGDRPILGVFGVEGIRRTADFWVDDDDIGTRQHKVYVRNLDLVDPAIIASLRSMLPEFPDWEIMVAVSFPAKAMGGPIWGRPFGQAKLLTV
jgi:hypothetical protein